MSRRTTILVAVLAALCCSSAMAAKKPLKVYILAGQSNMQGSAHKRTFAAIGDNPKTAALLSDIQDKNGSPVVCDNAWITYLTRRRDGDTVLHGKVKVGYGFDGERIGPEYAFGIYMDKALEEPVLIIKTAWGGKSLAVDFRPPGAGPYKPSPTEKQRGRAPAKEKVGHYGREYSQEYEDQISAVTHFLGLLAEVEEADRKIRQAFVDIEKNAALRFKHNPELKKQLAELKALRERMEKTLAKEVKTVQELRLGDSGHGIEGKIPGYTKDYHLEEFRK